MKDNILAVKTYTKNLGSGSSFTAKAEFSSIGVQYPYFSITGDLTERGRNVACGMMHDEVEKYFPELAPYIRWHLTSTDGPMHYLANAIYHAGFCLGMENARNLEYLRSTIVYGAVLRDTEIDLESLDAEQLKQWLTDRFPALMQQFRTDINTLFEKEVVTETASDVQAYTGTLSTPHNREVMRQKKRQRLIDQAEGKIREEQTELKGKLWLLDNGLSVDNVIYYSHRDIFTFGWRDKVKASERDAILDIISEFPFEYEIKAEDKVYSGRE